jgi:Spy/CpxP family protein refolding chaperone
MKTKLSLAAVSFLFILAFTLPVQQCVAQQDGWYRQEREIQKSPVQQEKALRIRKASIRMTWNGWAGNGMLLTMLNDTNFRSELGISDEQYEKIQEAGKNFRNPVHNPEVKKIYEEIQAIETANGRTLQNADEETKNRYFDLQEKVTALTTTAGNDSLNMFNVGNALEVALTHEQKQKMKEFQLVAALSDVATFPPSMFEALDLTNVQKQEMEKIKKELESEFEKRIEDLAIRQLMVDNTLLDECEKKGHNGIDFDILDESIRKQIVEDIHKIGNEREAHGKQYSLQFRTQMLDVLTDEQWLHLQNMIDDPSGLVKIMLDKVKARREQKEVWAPGPNSWRPGDPIPEQYRQERNRRKRFPGVEQSE